VGAIGAGEWVSEATPLCFLSLPPGGNRGLQSRASQESGEQRPALPGSAVLSERQLGPERSRLNGTLTA